MFFLITGVTKEIREIVWDHAKDYWRENPGLPKDGSSTAHAIAGPVNDELREIGAKPRSEKTIADHIRAGIRGKVFEIG